MASKISLLRSSGNNIACLFGIKRWTHIAAIPPSFDGVLAQPISPPPFALPEFDREPEKDNRVEFGFPGFLFGGSMELMAVPKKKTTPHKRGIRNGPKALKPVPVIHRCRSSSESATLWISSQWQQRRRTVKICSLRQLCTSISSRKTSPDLETSTVISAEL